MNGGSSASARFTSPEEVGRGAFGTVRRVFDEVRQEPVALKTLHNLAPVSLSQFKREFRSLRDVVHPRLVRIHELIEDEQGWHLVMDYVQGSSLAEVSLDGSQRARVFAQITEGLIALHDAGHVHRDLKPANVLIDERGDVRLVDFGLVIDRGAAPSGTWIGTPIYASPEQLSGNEVGPESDAYSLGVMLYESIVGRPPFEGRPMRIARDKRTTRPVRIESPEYADLLDGLLAPDPSERPSLSAVAQVLRPQPITAILPRPTERMVGRDDTLARLRAVLAETAKSRTSGFYCVEGRSGIGKSTVLRAFADSATEAVRLHGRCFEAETVPFKALDAIVDQLTADLAPRADEPRVQQCAARVAQLFPVAAALSHGALPPADADPRLRRLGAVSALAELFALRAEGKPLVLLLDDLHWADEDSLALLELIVGHEQSPPTLVVAAFRPEGRPRLRAFGEPEVLGPLSLEDARRVSSECAEPKYAFRFAELSGGDPFLLSEMCRYGRPPESIQSFTQSRLRSLSEPERSVLRLIALAGAPVPLRVFQEGPLVERAASVVDSLLERGYLLRTGSSRCYTVRHDRIARAASDESGSAELTQEREELSRAWFSASPATIPGQLVAKWDALLALGDRAATAFAWESAADFYRRALDASPEAERSAIWTRLGEVLSATGREREAAEAYRAGLAGVDEATARELRLRIAERLLRAGFFREGTEALADELERFGITLAESPPAIVASLLFHRARIGVLQRGWELPRVGLARSPLELRRLADLFHSAGVGLNAINGLRGSEMIARGLCAALESGDLKRITRGRLVNAMYLSGAGHRGLVAAKKSLREAEPAVESIATPDLVAMHRIGRCLIAFHGTEWRECQLFAKEVRALHAAGLPELHREVATVSLHETMSLFFTGDYEVADRQAQTLRHTADATSDRYLSRHMRSGFPVLSHLALHGPSSVRASVHEMQRAEDGFTIFDYCDEVALTNTELYEGKSRQAFARAEELWRRVSRSLLSRSRLVRLYAIDLRARAAFMARETGAPSRSRLIRAAIDELSGDTLFCAQGWGHSLRAAASADPSSRRAWYAKAKQTFERADMVSYARAAAAAGSGSDDAFRSALAEVLEPDRFARVLLPLRPGRRS